MDARGEYQYAKDKLEYVCVDGGGEWDGVAGWVRFHDGVFVGDLDVEVMSPKKEADEYLISILIFDSGFDAPFHLSEECSNANIASPRAIVMTAQLGLYLGWAIILVIA